MFNIPIFFVYCIAAVLGQNPVFTGGIGASRTIRSLRGGDNLVVYCCFVGVFTLLSTAVTFPVSSLIKNPAVQRYLLPVIFSVILTLLYFAAHLAVYYLSFSLYEKVEKLISRSAISGIVLGIPFAASINKLNFISAIGLAVGTGIGFAFAVFFIIEGISRMDNPDMPKAFRGIPSTLLYMGVLSMAFEAFSVNKLYV